MPKPSGTNHPKLARLLGGRPGVRRAGRQARAACLQAVCQSHTPEVPARRDCGGYSVWAHLFPFRTEKLKQTAPMVLPEEGGRVGRRPIPQPPHTRGLFFALTPNFFFKIRSLSVKKAFFLPPFVVLFFFTQVLKTRYSKCINHSTTCGNTAR